MGSTTWNIGTLTPGQSGSQILSGTITALGSETLINEATIYGETTCPNGSISASASATTHIIPTNLPDLTITRIRVYPPSPVEEYQRVMITAFVKNIGSATANAIEIIFLDGETQIDGTKTIGELAQLEQNF